VGIEQRFLTVREAMVHPLDDPVDTAVPATWRGRCDLRHRRFDEVRSTVVELVIGGPCK